MRLICFWCVLLAVTARAQENPYYAPQTFRQQVNDQWQNDDPSLFSPLHRPWNTMMRIPQRADLYNRQLFSPSNDVNPQGSSFPAGNSAPVYEQWRGSGQINPPKPLQPSPIKLEPWRAPFQITKEQQAAILHHKQALSSEGSFRFEYASDNGLVAGEVIEPDGSRVGAYQYKDPSGQLVKLKYRAGKDGFQILEGSHIPKSPEPVPPSSQDNHYQQAYAQQRQQYELQQQYNQQRPQQNWNQNQQQQGEQVQKGAAGQYYVQNWRPGPLGPGQEDDGQYRENEVDNQGPHNFGDGYAFAFQG